MGKLYVVATPIGNLEDMSFRAKSVLSQVNWIAAEDTRHSSGLLQHFNIHVPLIAYHDHNENIRVDALIQKLKSGESGALISDAGTPLISDPGYLLVSKALEANIPVIPIPGACAFVAALSVAGLPTDRFTFEGFLPAKSAARQKRFKELAKLPYTLIFYEAPHRVQDFLEDALQVLGPKRLATIAREITKKFESIYHTTLENLLQQVKQETIPTKGEFIVMVSGFEQGASDDEMIAAEQILRALLPELSLKKAVEITVKLSNQPKNKIYDLAMSLKNVQSP